jgi:hypothetical protein
MDCNGNISLMARGSRRSAAPPPAPPADAAAAAPLVRAFTVKLFDRQDGEGVNWRIIGETLFKAAFDVLDRLPDDQKHALAHRVYTGVYERFLSAAKDESGSSKTGSVEPENPPSITGVFKSSRPRPPQ